MPPRRRSSRASQKESDERLSIAETIIGLANSIEPPAFSPCSLVTRQNSHDDRSPADFARLPSMVVEEVDSCTSVPVSLPLPARTADVNRTADITGHLDIQFQQLRSQADKPNAYKQSQLPICDVNDIISQNQSVSTVTTLGISAETGHLYADGASSVSVPVSLNTDAMYGAVLMGWNPPVLASCPTASIAAVSPDEGTSLLSTLRTVDTANNDSDGAVIKLVIEPTSDGSWQLVSVPASAAFGAQQTAHSIAQVEIGNVSSASSKLVTAVDNSQQQLHCFGSLSVIGRYYNQSDSVSAGSSNIAVSKTHQQLSGHMASESNHSVSCVSSSEDAVTGSSILGSLSVLRDYYKRINSNIIKSSPLTTSTVQMFNSGASVASVGTNRISNRKSLQLKVPAVTVSIHNDQAVHNVVRSSDISSDIETKLSMKQTSASSVAVSISDDSNVSRILPAVSLDHHQPSISYDSTNHQLLTGSRRNSDALSSSASPEQKSPKRSSKLPPCYLPPKKRQKVSGEVHYEVKQNGCQHRTLDDEHMADDASKTANIDLPDISLTEETVTHTEHSSSDYVTASGSLYMP